MAKRRGQGDGTIYYREDRDRYCAQMTLEGGKRRTFYGKTRQEVARKLAKAQHDVAQGLPLVSERQTVADYLLGWLQSAKTGVRPTTWQRYEQISRRHIVPALGRVSLAKLDAARVEAFYSERLAAGVSPAMVRYIHRTFRRAIGEALRLGLVQRNVVAVARPPRVARREIHVLTRDQARALQEAAKGDRLEALYRLALHTGMRAGELLALTWDDVDLERGIVQVRRSLQRTADGGAADETKTLSSRRRLPIGASVVAALRAHRVQQNSERLALRPGWRELGLVFPAPGGGYLEESHLLRHQLHPLLRRAGLPQIRFHDLRHTAATLMLLGGLNPKVVSERLGHSGVAITLDLYSHVLPDMQQHAADTLEAMLGS